MAGGEREERWGEQEILSWAGAVRKKHPADDPGKVVHIPVTEGSVQFKRK